MTKTQLHGILLLDKPLGLSSNQALQKVKRLWRVDKIGHTGTLDPLATGVLPLCLGQATKFGQALLDADKSYEAIIQLGQTTTTGDREGEITATYPLPALAQLDWPAICRQFTGVMAQVPPMYSALKHHGKALYQLARQGQIIDRPPRSITVHALSLQPINEQQLALTVRCSKGTYIRVLAEDIAQALDTGGHLHSLRRTQVGTLPTEPLWTLAQLEAMSPEQIAAALWPIDSCVLSLPALALNPSERQRLLWGQRVVLAKPDWPGKYRLYDEQQHFLGLADYLADGQLLPQRLIHSECL